MSRAAARVKGWRLEKLSGRELEVLKLLCSGCTTKEIASTLGISFKTAASHRYSVFEKADVKNAVLLYKWALKKGLVKLDSLTACGDARSPDIISVREEAMRSSERGGIAKLLLDQLNDARHKHLDASEKFNLLIADVPSGTPDPDASVEIQQAAGVARAALQHYMKAMERSADFMVRGIVPEDVKSRVD